MQTLLAAHEELISAARGFGATLQAEARAARLDAEALGELEEVAGRLDEAAQAYGRARKAYGPCEWVVSDVLATSEADRLEEELAERSAALYSAAEAVTELAAEGPPQALEAARSILSRAALRYHETSRSIVAFHATLRRTASP